MLTINDNLVIKKLYKKKILILGLGREGLSTYKFLRENFPDKKLDIVDEKPLSQMSEEVQSLIENDKLVHFSEKPESNDYDEIFVSPGISPKKLHTLCHIPDTKLSTNTQLFFDLINETKNQKEKTKNIVIGVTGTKGKSTTTALIHHVLKENGFNAYLGGNIGIPALDLLNQKVRNQKIKKVFYVLELSSHQLLYLKSSPDIAVIQTIKEEHLDYYENFQQYVDAKANIAKFQNPNDKLVYFADNDTVTEIAKKSKAHKTPFSAFQQYNNIAIKDGCVEIDNEKLLCLDEVKLKGQHNLINMLPAIIIAKDLGVSDDSIAKAIKSFKGLPHRLEHVATIDGVEYYNDSLSTNPHAAIAAIETFTDKPIVLIAGGYDRGLDYSQLAEKILSSNIKHLILLPTTGEKILKIIQDAGCRIQDAGCRMQNTQVNSMTEAVDMAKKIAKKGDIVLLSPASASFNMFKDYAERGEAFKNLVTNSQVKIQK